MSAAHAQYYDIGNPNYQEIWVDPQSGSDSNSGINRNSALRTINAAWQRIPLGDTLSSAYKILLTPGNYPESSIPNYWENRHGTLSNPILIQASDGPGTVILQGDINAFDIDYLYLVNFTIAPVPAGDAFHCEQCDHLLLRGMTLSGGAQEAHETLKINQSKYIYIEDSDISGADDNSIDFVAVQYGHVVRNKIHNAHDWCMYLKGGSAQILVQANHLYNCGTGGFTAGQGTGFEFMTSPWLHYEAYDIKFINNIVTNTEGAGFGVNGGYNVLLAHNTLYKVGSRSHAIEVVYGLRSCDGDAVKCNSHLAQGGWGTSLIGTDGEPIPNKNVYIYNNIVFNPTGFESQYSHFAIYGPRTPANGSNLPSSVVSDTNLQIKGNIFWNDTPSLGIEDSDQGCQLSNPTCNQLQLQSDNYFNVQQPLFVNVATNDFRPAAESPVNNLLPVAIPSFIGGDRITPPLAPEGDLNNRVERDYLNLSRASQNKIGAQIGSLTSADAYLSWNSFLGMINIAELVNKGSALINIDLTVFNTQGQAISAIRVNLPAHSQQDIILNDLPGFSANSYGLVALVCSSSEMDARLSVYKITRGGFDFAYSSPILQEITGNSNVSFNTMQPSFNNSDSGLSVANWLSITNPDPQSSHSFTVYRYNQEGALLTSKRVHVPAFGRVDIEGGHENPGLLRVGLNRIVPDDPTSPYFANTVRYGLDRGVSRDFQFAYPILAANGADSIQYVPVSNGGGAQNWVEIINADSVAVDISIQVYNSQGVAHEPSFNLRIPAYAQYHYYASQNLAAGESGLAKITSLRANTVISHSLFYFYNSQQSIAAMYGIKSLSEESLHSFGSYNLFLNMANWLKIANITDSAKMARVRLYSGATQIFDRSYSVPALATLELPLHEGGNFNTQSNSYGLIEVEGTGIASHVLRIRLVNNQINFIFPTTVE